MSAIISIFGVSVLILSSLISNRAFFYAIFALKPVLDLTWEFKYFTLFGIGINSLRFIGFYVFIYIFISILFRKKLLAYNKRLVVLFLVYYTTIVLGGIARGNLDLAMGSTEILKTINCYFIYLSIPVVINIQEERSNILRTLWLGTFIASVISLISYYTGAFNTNTSQGTSRFAGLYYDATGPSYNALFSFIFATVYIHILPKSQKSFFLRLLHILTLLFCLFYLKVTLTRAAILLFLIFIMMWYIVYKKKIILIPIIITSLFLVYQNEDVQKRLSREVIVLSQEDYKESEIKQMGSGRVGIWIGYFELYKTFNLAEKIIGRGRTAGAAHSQYLDYLLEVGIIGLLLFLILYLRFFTYFCKTYMRRKCPFAFAALTMIILFMTLSLFINAFKQSTFLWYLMIIMSIAHSYSNTTQAQPTPHINLQNNALNHQA